MSIWTRISEAISALSKGQSLADIFSQFRTPPEKSVAFTIAVIALGAKMAKADGIVTKDEVVAFRQVFQIAKDDEPRAAKVFNLARQDVAGYDVYANNISKMFSEDNETLRNVIEGLFHISMADGVYHPEEDAFIAKVANIFGIPQSVFTCLRSQYVPGAAPDPYTLLDVQHDAPFPEIRAAWRKKVREVHPDNLIAHGLPEEAIALANTRMIAINQAWEEIKKSHTF